MFVPKIHSELQFFTIPNLVLDKKSKDSIAPENIEDSFKSLADYLYQNQLTLLSERIFGDLKEIHDITAIRNNCYQEYGLNTYNQPTIVEGKSPFGEPFSGIQAIAVSANDEHSIQWLKHNETIYGALFNGADAEYVLLTDMARSLSTIKEPSTQTIKSLEIANEILSTINWSYKDVHRTWFYLDSILDWYDEFNTARNGVYRSLGILNGRPLGNIPASTGIEGKNAGGHACTLDLLAMHERSGCPLEIQQLRNPKQNEATEYGSAFSRAISIQTKINTYVFISGTASIDEQGKTIYPNDPEKQIRRTFENIASLLNHHHAGYKDIVQATAFCKEAKDFALFENIAQEYGLNMQTVVQTVADVCRDDLLFEMDATALIDQHL